MLENSTLYSRLLFVFALVCAAVMLFIMCSDAARASPITTQVDNGVHSVLRRLYTPHNQHHPPSTDLLSTITGIQSETEMSGNSREASSIINHQSNPLWFTKGSFSYSRNIPDNRQFRAGITGVQNEMSSASSITGRSQHRGQSSERQQSRVNYHPLSHEVAQSGNSYHSYPVIIRKSSRKEAASPFYQRVSPSQVWDPKDAQKSYNKEKILRNDSPKVTEDETVWQPSDSSLFSSQTGRYWSTSLPTSGGLYSSYKKTNELAVVGPRSTSSGTESSKFLGFTGQTAPHASVSNRLDASVIKRNPSQEKLTSSITDFSQGLQLVSNSDTPRLKKFESYLFKDSQSSFGGRETDNTVTGDGPSAISTTPHKQRPADAQMYSRFSSNFKQSQREGPTNEVQHLFDNASPRYHNANKAQNGPQTDSFTRYHRTTAETLAQMSVNPASGTDNTMESFVHKPHPDFQANYATGSEKSVVSSLVNTTTGGSMHASKSGRTTKSIYGFRGFKNPTWQAVKEPSILSSSGSNERTYSRRYSLDKGKFKIANINPSLSPKYSFGQREASNAPAKLERPSTDYPSSATGTYPGTGFKDARPLLPESDAGMDSNPDRRQFRIYRRIYGLKGFGTRPLEGTKPLVSEPNKSARVQQGFKIESSQTWQPKSSRIHRWYNKTGSGSSHVSTVSQDELNSEDLKPPLKTAGSTDAVTRFTPDKYKKNHKIYTPLGFRPVQNRTGNAINKTRWKYKEQNPTTESHRISSAYLRSAWDLKVESIPKSEPRTLNKTKLVARKASLLNSSTSSTVRGKRVKGKHTNSKKLNESTSLTRDAANVPIVRLPKRPAKVKAVMYADILGSASFSGVKATTQTPITPADKDYFPNTTAMTKQKEEVGHWTLNSKDAVHSRDNTSRDPEAHPEYEREDFSSVEENKAGVRSDMKTSDLFLDDEGSGSGGFNMSDVFPTDATKSQGLSEDLLELDYLRISTGNISFKSMKLSHTEK